MSKFETLVNQNHNALCAEMRDLYRYVLECDGQVQYSIYLWDDGEIEWLLEPQGGRSRLIAKDYEPRELFYVCCVDSPFFDWKDFCDFYALPDDETSNEYEMMHQETIDWLVNEYDVEEILEQAIRDHELMEEESQ